MRMLKKAPKHIRATGRDERIQEDVVKWSGAGGVPAVGESIHIGATGFGSGRVVGYAVACGWLGVYVQLDSPPEWYVSQSGGKNPPGLFFGAEISR